MARSMTAFAHSSGDTQWGDINCELRTVNHRFLEISPRLSDELRQFEPQIRDIIAKGIKRGRVDCTMRFQPQIAATQHLAADEVLVDALVAVAADIRSRTPELEPLRVADLLRWPGVVKTPELDADALRRATEDVLTRAVADLVAVRRREGRRLMELLTKRVVAARVVVNQVQGLLPEISQGFRQRLEARLAELQTEVDQNRLEQEIVLFLQKIDVAEEVDRLIVHLDEVHAVSVQDQPIGRRLDFLMQELLREANTLAAKSVDTRITRASVDLKVLIEQMREQVQNIE